MTGQGLRGLGLQWHMQKAIWWSQEGGLFHVGEAPLYPASSLVVTGDMCQIQTVTRLKSWTNRGTSPARKPPYPQDHHSALGASPIEDPGVGLLRTFRNIQTKVRRIKNFSVLASCSGTWSSSRTKKIG
jgi:hypothetical protein